MAVDFLGGLRCHRLKVGATIVLGTTAVAVLVASERRRRQISDDHQQQKPSEHPTKDEKIDISAGAQQAAEVRKDALRREEEEKAPVEVVEESSGGCGRNKGPLGGWQNKLHAASLAVNETLLALRGGAPSVRVEFRQILEHLATTETILHDSVYCTGKEAQIQWLMQELEPLFGADVSSKLLHPLNGEALRQDVIYALTSWEEMEVFRHTPSGGS
mmetsp:Transcript_22559/g.36219  ORF Transcript_22559/g.36219 Transcript_22559/m.36219 type:complete len:216 (-) Transcript_22559:116-763(-)